MKWSNSTELERVNENTTCIHKYMYTHIYVYIPVYSMLVPVQMDIQHTYIYMCTTYTYTQIYTYICMHTYAHVYTCMRTRTCTHACVHTHTGPGWVAHKRYLFFWPWIVIQKKREEKIPFSISPSWAWFKGAFMALNYHLGQRYPPEGYKYTSLVIYIICVLI